jgi:hypothetical protein
MIFTLKKSNLYWINQTWYRPNKQSTNTKFSKQSMLIFKTLYTIPKRKSTLGECSRLHCQVKQNYLNSLWYLHTGSSKKEVKKLMIIIVFLLGDGLQDANESRLKSSFRKFYGRYDDLVCGYNLSLSHVSDCHIHTGLWGSGVE